MTKCQYETDKAKLATKILDQKEGDQKCTLDPSIVEATYKVRFGGVSQEVDLSSYPTPSSLVDNDMLMAPFTPNEVKIALARSNKKTAAGPECVDLAMLAAEDKQGRMLCNLFKSWLFSGRVPTSVKENRSILLPKGSEGLDDINNWRPLTISSVLPRLYTNVVTGQVSRLVDMNPRQRGFISVPGCGENGFLLEQIISHSKANRRSLCITFLDLAKAFNTVSHKHIIAGLRQLRMVEHFVNMVIDLYSDVSTTFTNGGGTTDKIPMTRGVKQGDPPLTIAIQHSNGPTTVRNHRSQKWV